MVQIRKPVKVDFIDAQREFLKENGIEEEDGMILSKMMLLMFKTGKDGKLSSYTGSRKISLDWNSTAAVQENELWVCQVTMKTYSLGFAEPIRKVEFSEIIGISDQMQGISDYIWETKKKKVIEHLGPQIESVVKSMGDLRRSELEAEYKEKKSALEAELELRSSELMAKEKDQTLLEENLRSKMEGDLMESREELIKEYEQEIDELKERLSSFKSMDDRLINEKSTIMSYYESQNKDLRENVKDLTNELSILRKRLDSGVEESCGNRTKGTPSRYGTLIRISKNEFKSLYFREGRYSVKINPNLTKIRFTPDDDGLAICRNGIIVVPGLNQINALNNYIGEVDWKIVDTETIEISI